MPTDVKRIPYLKIENLQNPYPLPQHIPIEPILVEYPLPWAFR